MDEKGQKGGKRRLSHLKGLQKRPKTSIIVSNDFSLLEAQSVFGSCRVAFNAHIEHVTKAGGKVETNRGGEHHISLVCPLSSA